MTGYNCFCCNNFNATSFNHILRHLSKVKNCMSEKKNENKGIKLISKYTQDELLVLSLLPNDTFISKDIKNDIFNIKNISLNDNKIKILNLLHDFKGKNCLYCNKQFKKTMELKNHIILKCFMDNIECKRSFTILSETISEKTQEEIFSTKTETETETETNNQDPNIKTSDINNNSNNILHYHNIINSNNTTINNSTYNITIELKNPVSFSEDWLIDHLNQDEKDLLLIHKQKFSKLLSLLLKNDSNLNVVIDLEKNKTCGIVYENDDENYKKMNLEEICEETMKKLNNLLESIIKYGYKEDHLCNQISESFTRAERIDTRDKYKKYTEILDTKERVNKHLLSIFNEFKEKSNEIFENIQKKNDNIEKKYNYDASEY